MDCSDFYVIIRFTERKTLTVAKTDSEALKMKVKDLKDLVKKKYPALADADGIRLTYKSTMMEDQKTLGDYDVKRGAEIMVMLKQHGEDFFEDIRALLRSLMSKPHCYNVVLLGKTRAGKSASGNTILGRKEFSSKTIKNQTSVTRGGSVVINGVTLRVYDTPGLFDPETKNEDVMREWTPLLPLHPWRPTVFLLVMKIDRFTPEEKSTVELVEQCLGDERLQNTWILFTRGDELERERRTIEEFIEENEELKGVVQRFNNRYHVFNNRTQNPDQARRLIEKLRRHQSGEDGKQYQNELECNSPVQTNQMNSNEKRFTSLDKNITLVTRPSDLDPMDNDNRILRAVLSCGHVTGPDSLTDFCKCQLESGATEFRCPVNNCNKEWSYAEVRKLAKLTREEKEFFEETLGNNAAIKLADFKACPGCDSYIVRSDTSNLSVQCTVCCERTERTYEFCWQCLREWKGPRPRSDKCDNEDCTDEELKLLRICKTIKLPQVQNIQCPSVRACPTCGTLLEHNTENCKNIECWKCKKQFCFFCLKLTPDCLKTSSYFKPCSAGVAPKQTSIPSRKM